MAKWLEIHGEGQPVLVNMQNVLMVNKQVTEDGKERAAFKFLGDGNTYLSDESYEDIVKAMITLG